MAQISIVPADQTYTRAPLHPPHTPLLVLLYLPTRLRSVIVLDERTHHAAAREFALLLQAWSILQSGCVRIRAEYPTPTLDVIIAHTETKAYTNKE